MGASISIVYKYLRDSLMRAVDEFTSDYPIKSYSYIPLTPNSSEVRFLILQPGPWAAKLECTLRHDFLHKKPIYEALSYTWGELKATRPILLNGARFDTRINLETALRYLRLEDSPRTLWVDAICIDQDNLHERSEQVKLMRQIYTLAGTVIAWVGEADEDSENAMALMQETSNLMLSETELLEQESDFSPERMRQSGFDVSTKNWTALRRFWQQPYWSRMWVVQELSCSGDPFEASENRCVIRCGHTTIGLHQYVDTCIFVFRAQRSSSFIPNGVRIEEPVRTMSTGGESTAASQMCAALLLCLGKGSDYLLVVDLMNATKRFMATDCRDKLYAILGLTREVDMAIVPDYTKPPAEVYIDLVRFLIDHDHNLQSLTGNRQRTNEFGPSWIPELYGLPTSGPAWANENKTYRASGILEADALFNAENSLLQLRGNLLGTLNRVIGPFAPKDKDPVVDCLSSDGLELHKAQGLNVPFEALAEFQKTLDITQHEIFWRTVVMDADHTDIDNPVIPAPDEFGLMFKILRGMDIVPENYKPDLPKRERVLGFCRALDSNMGECTANRCFFTTACGRMGIGPYCSKPGDVVAVLFGGDLCFVLRPKMDRYELIGDAYVHGVMRGELFGGPAGDQIPASRTFTLC